MNNSFFCLIAKVVATGQTQQIEMFKTGLSLNNLVVVVIGAIITLATKLEIV